MKRTERLRTHRRRGHGRIFALVLAAILGVAPSGVAAARSDWRRVTIGHLQILSTLSDANTRDIALQLQAFEQTVGTLLQTDDRPADVPTTVYLIGHADFAAYAADRPGLMGFFKGREFGNILVSDTNYPFAEVRYALLTEFAGAIQHSTSAQHYPRWFTGGFAQLFGSFQLDGNQVTVGAAPKNLRLSLDRTKWIPIERVLAIKALDWEEFSPTLMPQFAAESWALVHYLLFDQPTLAAPTKAYLSNVDLGVPEAAAFEHAFPFDKAGLDAALQAHLKAGKIVSKRLTFAHAPEIEQAAIEHLTAPEADAELARLSLDAARPQSTVQPLMDAALKERPDDASVQALAARVAAHFKAPFDAGSLIERAKAGHLSGQALLDLTSALRSYDWGGARPTIVRTVLDPVVHAGNPPIEAVVNWAVAGTVIGAPSDSYAPVLEPALARAPHDSQLLTVLAAAYMQLGARAKARACYTRLLVSAETPQARAWAQRQADSPELADPPETAKPAGSDARR